VSEILGPLQLRVMPILWRKPATVHEIHDELNAQRGAPKLAYTTVLTVVRNLRARGFVEIIPQAGRSFLWKAVGTKDGHQRAMLSWLLKSHFDGDKRALGKLLVVL
jgi:predicted transcriptional regulator